MRTGWSWHKRCCRKPYAIWAQQTVLKQLGCGWVIQLRSLDWGTKDLSHQIVPEVKVSGIPKPMFQSHCVVMKWFKVQGPGTGRWEWVRVKCGSDCSLSFASHCDCWTVRTFYCIICCILVWECVGYEHDALVCSIEAVASGFEIDEVIEQLAGGTTNLLLPFSLTFAMDDPYQTRSLASA